MLLWNAFMQFIWFSSGSEGYWAFSCSSNTLLHDFHIYRLWEILSRLSFIIAHDIFKRLVLSAIVKNGRYLQPLVFLCVCHTKLIKTTSFQLKCFLPQLNLLVKPVESKKHCQCFLNTEVFFHKDWYTLLWKEAISRSDSDPVITEEKGFHQKQCSFLAKIHWSDCPNFVHITWALTY